MCVTQKCISKRLSFESPPLCNVINDLPEVVRAILYLFADDKKLMKTITSLEDSILLQNDINALEKWSKTWLLNFHPNKCHVLTLGKFENIRLPRLSTWRHDAWACLQRKRSWYYYRQQPVFRRKYPGTSEESKLDSWFDSKEFLYLSLSLFRQLYTSFVRSHLKYAQVIWSSKLRKHSKLLEDVQRRAIRIVESCKIRSYTSRLELIRIPTLEYRRAVDDMVEVYIFISTTRQQFQRYSPPEPAQVETTPSSGFSRRMDTEEF